MAGEAASALGLSMAVLAESAEDAACDVVAEVLIGSPQDEGALRSLANRCDVVTFDHELVDLSLVSKLASEGVAIHPGADALALAVDKVHMRAVFTEAGIPVPAHAVLDLTHLDQAGIEGALKGFGQDHGWPLVLKTARGGYDGKGVWPVDDLAQATAVLAPLKGQILVEERVDIAAELAVMVARRPSGETMTWPAVETAQVGGVCREVLVPGRLPAGLVEEAGALGRHVAELAGAAGVMAVELFWTGSGLMVNEIASRPHNSGHWTIEGAVTSQFENHLRAVLDLPLGSTLPSHPQVASVNVFGGESGSDPAALLPRGLAIEGAHIHLYGKGARPGRKLGHVTVCGDNPEEVRARAWKAALALGTPRPASLQLPDGVA
jgi:5-(carboxyamino)imidazole ribonucleotide synthase